MTATPVLATTATATTRAGRLDYLDAVRGIASMLVVVHHTLESLSDAYSDWSHSHVDLGRLGVVAFFVVSGYVVGLTLSKQTPYTFSVRRFWRLYPIYWLATALSVVVWIATGHEWTQDLGLVTIVANILMIQGFIGAYSILGVAWTLGIEIAFYAQSVVTKLARLLDKSAWIGFAWLGVFAAMAVSNWQRGTSFSAVVPLMMFTASLGFAIYRWDKHRDRTLWWLLGAAITVVPVLGWMLATTQDQPGVWPAMGFNSSYLGGLALFGVLYLFRTRTAPRWLLWLGAVSYSLYLTHTTVIQLVGATPLWGVGAVVASVSVVAASLVVAGLLHRYVERPSTDLGRRLTSPGRRSP